MSAPSNLTDQERALWEAEARLSHEHPGPWHYYSCGEKSNDCILGIAVDEDGNPAPPGRVECDRYNEKTGEYEEKYTFDPVFASAENDADYEVFDFICRSRNAVRQLLEEISKLRYALLRANAGKLLEEIARLRGALMRIKNWRQEGQMVIFEDLVAIAREALEERKP